MIRHIVLFKAKPTNDGTIDKIFHSLTEIRKTTPGIMLMSYGPQATLPDSPQSGFTHGFSMDFIDENYYKRYLQQPSRAKVIDLIDSVIENDSDIIIFDYPIEIVLPAI